MDVFEYRTSRSFNTDGVFTTTGSDTELSGLFLRLKNLMTTELHLQWDTAFLEQYVKENIVPRGLRWDVFPQQGESDIDSWFRYFNDAGTKLLIFLIDKKKSRLISIDREIRELKEKFTPHKTSLEYISLSTTLKSHLEKEEKEQRLKKQKKYNRDIIDYRSNLVFGWQKKIQASLVSASENLEMEVIQSDGRNLDRTLTFEPVAQNTSVRPPPNPKPLGTGPTNKTLDSRPKTRVPNTQVAYPSQPRGRGPRSRGKGPHRGQSRDSFPSNYGRPRDSYHYESPRRPGANWRDYHEAPRRGGHDGQFRTPSRPYNRPLPFYDDYTREEYYDSYNDRDRDIDLLSRSPDNYNQYPSGPSHPSGFHRAVPDYLGSPEGKEVSEKVGGSRAKRPRTR